MTTHMRLTVLLAGICMTLAAHAAGMLHIENPRSYPTAAPGITAAGFLDLRNEGPQDDRLLRAESPQARQVEIHEMRMADGMMHMRALPEGLPLPAGQRTSLAPGGVHLMLFGPDRALRPGDAVPLVLWFEKAGRIETVLRVVPRPAS